VRNDNILLGRCVGISAHSYSIEQQEGLEMNDISCNLESEKMEKKHTHSGESEQLDMGVLIVNFMIR